MALGLGTDVFRVILSFKRFLSDQSPGCGESLDICSRRSSVSTFDLIKIFKAICEIMSINDDMKKLLKLS